MIRTVQHVQVVTFQSEMLDTLKTTDEQLGKLIEWGDAHPLAYRIVTETRSLGWGRDSNRYYGIDRQEGTSALFGRLRTFMRAANGQRFLDRGSILIDDYYSELAKHTLAIYSRPGFESGTLVQWDGKFNRGLTSVDWAGKKDLAEVVSQFVTWCDSAPFKHHTQEVRLYRGHSALSDHGKVERVHEVVWNGCDHPSRKRGPTGELVCEACHYVILDY